MRKRTVAEAHDLGVTQGHMFERVPDPDDPKMFTVLVPVPFDVLIHSELLAFLSGLDEGMRKADPDDK